MPTSTKSKSGTKVTPLTAPSIPQVGYLDREGVMAVFPVGKDYWDEGVRNGKYPAPVRIAARRYAWRVEDIKKLIRNMDEETDLLTLKSKRSDDKLTFEALALQWLAKRQRETSAKQCSQHLRWLEDHVFPYVGKLSPKLVNVNHVVQILQRSGRRVSPRTATNVKQMLVLIFRFGVMNDLCAANPAALIRVSELIPEEERKNHPAISPDELPELMGCLARNDARLKAQTRLALRLLTHTFVRNQELRLAEWKEIDFRHRLWLIPAHRMKMRRDHLVPLSRQSLAILRELKVRAGKSRYVFPSMNLNRAGEPMAENVCYLALDRMGYRGRHCPHGFRSLATTALLEKHRVPLRHGVSSCIASARAHKDDAALVQLRRPMREKGVAEVALRQRASEQRDLRGVPGAEHRHRHARRQTFGVRQITHLTRRTGIGTSKIVPMAGGFHSGPIHVEGANWSNPCLLSR